MKAIEKFYNELPDIEDLIVNCGSRGKHNYAYRVIVYVKHETVMGYEQSHHITVANGKVIAHTYTFWDNGKPDVNDVEDGSCLVGQWALGLGIVRKLGYKVCGNYSLSEYCSFTF